MKVIRSTKMSLKEVNPRKIRLLTKILLEYSRVVNLFIDLFWESTPSKSELLKPVIDLVLPAWISYSLRQAAAREAVGMVVGAKQYAETINKIPIKPTHHGGGMCVSGRIASLNKSKHTKNFDAWLHLSSINHHSKFKKIILDLPVKLHKHYHKLSSLGTKQHSCIITLKYVQFSFEIDTGEKCVSNRSIGVDTGIKTLASTSTGHQFGKDVEGLLARIKRCRHGSKGQKTARRALHQRMDEVAIELFDTLKPTLVVAEKLRGLNKLTRVKRSLTKNMRRSIGSWAYRYWLGRLERECEMRRSRFRSVSPYKTSQRCSACGHTDRSNRSGEVFLCKRCGHSENADTNAGKNILDRFLTGPYGAGCKPLIWSEIA